MEKATLDRARGCAVGAAVGDALGMPLEFKPARPLARLEREMIVGRLPAGSFTDDTEMALALAESLVAACPLDPIDLAARFLAWYRAGPADMGSQTVRVVTALAEGHPWQEAVAQAQAQWPASAGNGSVMRCWPVALVHHADLPGLLADSRLQSQVTHPHPECVAASMFVNGVVYELLHGATPAEAVARALELSQAPAALRVAVAAAAARDRPDLENSGWVRHTVVNAVWSLLTTRSFEDALVQAVNLGGDADTVGAVAGMLAGAAYGLQAIPARWRRALRGEWPLRSGRLWREADFLSLVDRLLAAPCRP